MQPRNRTTNQLVTALAVMAVLVWTGLWGSHAAFASGDNPKANGILQSAPASTLVGSWTIGGVVYQATSSTEFEANEGPFVTGACVKVEYLDSTSPFTALKMQTEPASDCNGTSTPDASETPDGTGTPEASRTPDGTGTPESSRTPNGTGTPESSRTPNGTGTPESSRTPEASETPGGGEDVKGLVQSMPSPGLIGSWTIGGVAYETTSSTRFKQEDGPFVVGACVEVEYSSSSTPRTATEIKTQEQEECSRGGTGTPGATTTPGATGTPSGEAEARGRVDSFPTGLVGNWVVNGVTYSASSATEFKEDHGSFGQNACVKIHYSTTSTPFEIREIETEQDYRCSGGSNGGGGEGEDHENELYGVLQSFPDGFIGTWNVGGVTFEVDASTELNREHGQFEIGSTVKVHFSVDSNGVNHASEIETKYGREDEGHDDDGNGSVDGSEGHAYGVLENLPANKLGVWTISGVDYTVDSSTKLKENDGAFAVGGRVKIEYYLGANGERIAHEIETTSSTGDSSSADHFKVFGFVDQMPASSFVGQWVINNITFEADTSTKFKEEHGILGLGAYVAVEYSSQGGVNQIHEIETHVPPGAGSTDRVGEIESIGSVSAAGVSASATWSIGGITYSVTAATDLKELSGDFAVGATASVNSYAAADGTQVATQIRTINLVQRMLLPIVKK